MEKQTNQKTTLTVRFEEASLFGLVGAERHAATDAIIGGEEFPLVVVGSTLACAGEFDVDAIASAVERTQSH